jgi:hypothetical protein
MATTAAQNLDAAIANITLQLANITANPKPSYQVDGEEVRWTEYQQMLQDKLNALMRSRQDLDGAWLISTRGT